MDFHSEAHPAAVAADTHSEDPAAVAVPAADMAVHTLRATPSEDHQDSDILEVQDQADIPTEAAILAEAPEEAEDMVETLVADMVEAVMDLPEAEVMDGLKRFLMFVPFFIL